ncbi:YlzJ-like family protein [Heyndrickxia sp. NPDC080065]|uniref:YlzJ-like family protein n=1 Tax=Heyndrickxia sp. NPDC080065 TaxID=3390568 RepID=UPI003CFE67C3
MILYTIIPHDLVFPIDSSEFSNYKEIMYNGIPILVEQMENNYRVVRVLSSNPVDFLRGDITPGQMISFY